MLIYFKTRSASRTHAATLRANGKPCTMSENVTNAVTGSKWAVNLKPNKAVE